MMPVFSLVLDEDVSVEAALKFPPLYKTLQLGRSLNLKTFLIWMWKSIFQGCLIMLGTVVFFNESQTNIVTITFTALIITELLNVYSELHKIKREQIVSSVITFLMYILSVALMRSYFNTSYLSFMFFVKVFLITLASWLPLHVIKILKSKIDPDEHEKIMKDSYRL
jgi:phospholipid-translocating ATPase